MDLDALRTSDEVVAGSGTVLLVDLVFLPWHSFEIGPVALTWSAVEGPNAALGVVAALVAAATVAVTLLRAKRGDRDLPAVPLGWDRATLAGAAAVLGLVVVKLVLDTDRLGVGAWLGVALAVAMAAGAALGVARAPADVAE